MSIFTVTETFNQNRIQRLLFQKICNYAYPYLATCIPLPKNLVPPREGISSLAISVYQILARNVRFFCPRCTRTRRPSLDCLVEFLTLLQKMLVRVPEGEGIEFLTQRAMRWVDRARDFLDREEVSEALMLTEPVGVLHVQDIPLQFGEAYARTGSGEYVAVWRPGSEATITSDIVNESKIIAGLAGTRLWNEQLKDFIGKPSLDPRNCTVDPNSQQSRSTTNMESNFPLHTSAGASFTGSPEAFPNKTPMSDPFTSLRPPSSPPMLPGPSSSSGDRSPSIKEAADALIKLCQAVGSPPLPVVPERKPSPAELCMPSTSKSAMMATSLVDTQNSKYDTMAEHTYSSMMAAPPETKKIRRKSLLLNRDAEEEEILHGPRIHLPAELIAELDDLLLEGDLMEVSITETEKLYRLREFTKPPETVLDIMVMAEPIRAHSIH